MSSLQGWCRVEEFNEPVHYDFTPKMKKDFKERKISRTSLAPVWGQESYYFNDPVWELNSGPRQNDNPMIKYQQDWVETKLQCPFCNHDYWNLTYAVTLRPSEESIFDPQKIFYILLCPKCERAVEAIPRKLVDVI